MTSPAGTREFLPGRASWLALGAFTLFTLIGFAIRLPGNAPIALIGAVVAIGAAAFLLRCRQRVVLAYAALATVGVAMLGNGAASNVGWFAVAVLGMWCVLAGTRRDGLLFWGGALVLFGIEWVFVELDAGWGAWMAGVSFAALGALLRRHEVGLAIELRAAQAGLAERTRAEERGRIAHELHDIVAHSLTVSLLQPVPGWRSSTTRPTPPGPWPRLSGSPGQAWTRFAAPWECCGPTVTVPAPPRRCRGWPNCRR